MLLLALLSLEATLPKITPASHRFRAELWESEQGIPQNYVSAITQTPDGYLWVSMINGVARFDGQRFHKVLNIGPSQSVRCLFVSRDGTLWAGTNGQGALRMGAEILPWEYNAQLLSKDTRSITESQDGALWVGTANQLVRWKDGKARVIYPTETHRKVRGAYTLIPEGTNGVLVGTSRGLYRAEEDTLTRLTLPERMDMASITALTRGPDGSLWVGTGGMGIARISANGEIAVLDDEDGLPSNHVRTLLFDNEGRIWAGTMQGLVHWNNDRFIPPEVPGLEMDYDILSLTQDAESNLWVGGIRGLVRLNAGRFALLNKSIGVGSRILRSVKEFSDGSLWIGTANGGVTRIQDGVSQTFRLKPGIERTEDTILAIEEIEPGVAAVGTYRGFFIVRNDASEAPLRSEVFGDEVKVIHKDAGGTVWFGTSEHGLFVRDNGILHWFRTKPIGDPESDIRAITDDGAGGLWVGTAGGLIRRQGEQVTLLSSENGLPSDSIQCLLRDPLGVLWIGTDLGLARLANGVVHFWTEQRGLLSNDIREVIDDGLGYLWLSSPAGLFRMRKADLESSLREGEKRLLGYMRFGPAWGVSSCVSPSLNASTATKLRDGRLAFATSSGLLVVEPSEISPNPRKPPVVIDQVTFGNRTIPIQEGKVTIGPGLGSLELGFSALSYQDPSRVLLRYHMKGVDEDWIQTQTRRTVSYHNLQHGSYTFTVIACNNDGLWNEEGQSLTITVLPYLYETTWFKILAIFLLFSLSYGAYRLRLRHLRNAKEMLSRAVDERTQSLKEEIATRKRTEGELLHSQQQVFRLQKIEATGQLAAGIAHDFNNLLTVILGQLSLVESSPEPVSEDDLDSIKQARSAAERAATLTKQLLMFSRKQRIDPRPFQINGMLSHLLQILKPVMGENVELQQNLAPNLPLLNGDETLLEQVMVNIAVNARDAMPNGGRFLLKTELQMITAAQARLNTEAREGTFIRISARDTGSGMSPEVIERIFEPFFTTKEPGRGTGLGMPMVFGTIKQHEGWIEIHSEVGKGTEIALLLPAAAETVEAPREPRQTKAPGQAKGCILYVEDELGIRHMVRKTLEREGYRVLLAADAPAAIQVWKEFGPSIDLVFSDIVMPGGISGAELVERLRSERPSLKVLLATGYSSKALLPDLRSGIRVLNKPFVIEDLLARIHEILTEKDA